MLLCRHPCACHTALVSPVSICSHMLTCVHRSRTGRSSCRQPLQRGQHVAPERCVRGQPAGSQRGRGRARVAQPHLPHAAPVQRLAGGPPVGGWVGKSNQIACRSTGFNFHTERPCPDHRCDRHGRGTMSQCLPTWQTNVWKAVEGWGSAVCITWRPVCLCTSIAAQGGKGFAEERLPGPSACDIVGCKLGHGLPCSAETGGMHAAARP